MQGQTGILPVEIKWVANRQNRQESNQSPVKIIEANREADKDGMCKAK